jgi:KUP system potassium uptake protein
VFGDLGTSPLYVYPSIVCASTPNEEDFLGILSLIFWTLSLIGVFKYVWVVLQADDHGEGIVFLKHIVVSKPPSFEITCPFFGMKNVDA